MSLNPWAPRGLLTIVPAGPALERIAFELEAQCTLYPALFRVALSDSLL